MHSEPTTTTGSAPAGTSRPLGLLFALTCGASVSSLYVLQPVLEAIRTDFSISTSTAALVVTAA